ncbi:CapA family protein [Tenggerimyces flavus]|uniref:CapA family protein n=1 Tax=Tenggerimyces flavus TaxID=1708749 RepID=A0ABV7YEC4_9ACTN|nr:CapA family protein [Tenggerimyces flavus]MBM7787839.1 poly-gamma-glutamate synthesis protein (capsule biosynthesis protein) [Tenggerimyces flavus]
MRPSRPGPAATVVLLGCLAASSLAGCLQDPVNVQPDPPKTSTAPKPATSPSKTSTPQPEAPAKASPTKSPEQPEKPKADDELTFAFAGDVHFEEQVRALLDDPENSLRDLRDYTAKADLTMVNLETAIATGGSPEQKRFRFRTPPTALEALKNAGIDVVTLANNHGVDFGRDGLEESLEAKENGAIPVVGIGKNRTEAFKPYETTIRGTKVAVLGADAFRDPTTDNWTAGADSPGIAVAIDPARIVRAVRDAKKDADIVVVYLHWGTEYQGCPTDLQRELADKVAEAGATIIVGSHAHIQLGSGMHGDTFVSYGLGNFIWYSRKTNISARTGVLTVAVRPDGEVTDSEWAPGVVTPSGLPEFATGDRADELLEAYEKLRDCADLDAVR